MITPDDNGYGRVKRWRAKNRALVNLKQRNYRKKKKGGDAPCQSNSKTETEKPLPTPIGSNSVPTVQSVGAARMTIEDLRELERQEREKPRVKESVKPLHYRNDFGAIISESQWKRLQEKKRQASEGGYVLDEYSQ